MRLVQRRLKSRRKLKKFHYHTRTKEAEGGDDGDGEGVETPRRWISYELFQWTWFLVLTILAVADRFGWNVWPRQTYSIGAGSAGNDRMTGFKVRVIISLACGVNTTNDLNISCDSPGHGL